MQKQNSIISIAATYVATVVGAGYASGQEILQYFSYFREFGLYAIVIASVFFFVFGYLPVALAYRFSASDYLRAINPKGQKIFIIFCDIFITLSLFGTLVIMLAGAGATFEEKFSTPAFVGAFIVCILLIANTSFGLDMVVKVMTFITPIMFIGILFVGIYSIFNAQDYSAQEIANAEINNSSLITHWWLSGILYVAFNFQLALAVLVPMTHHTPKSQMFKGILLGSLLLGGFAAFLYFSLYLNIIEVGTAKLPMVILANKIHYFVGIFYSIVLFLALYSTALTCFYGSANRFQKSLKKLSPFVVIIITAVGGFFASLFGLKELIGTIYPILGYGGMVIMVLILKTYFVD